MEIPARIIDAAARALCTGDVDSGIEEPEFSWDTLPEFHRDLYREEVQLVLEAAFAEGFMQELIRIQFGPEDGRLYAGGGVWDPRPLNFHLTKLHETKNLLVERKLVIEFLLDPMAVTDEEVL